MGELALTNPCSTRNGKAITLLRSDELEKMKRRLKKLKTLATEKMTALPLARKWQENREFSVERKLIKGQTVSSTNTPSIIHYSINKAATQFTKSIMVRCGQENGLVVARFSDYAWVSSCPYLFDLSKEEIKPYLKVFQPRGLLYTVFGGMVESIPDIEKYRPVIMIRDPRDVLVSAYYSYSTSHSVPHAKDKAEEFLELRERISTLSVDDYVKEMCSDTEKVMSQYVQLNSTCPSARIMKYEDMISDFSEWFETLINHCGWTVSAELRAQIEAQAAKARTPSGEDSSRHRRQVLPGDYKRKLQPETITYLNHHLADCLRSFDYR